MSSLSNEPATVAEPVPKIMSTKITIQGPATNEKDQLPPAKKVQGIAAMVSTSADTNKVDNKTRKIIKIYKIRERTLPQQFVINSINLVLHMINLQLICPRLFERDFHVTEKFIMNFGIWIEVMIAVYWPIYIYDPMLITPKSLRDINFDSFISNHIMHTWAGVFLVFESGFYPRVRTNKRGMYAEAGLTTYLVALHAFLISGLVLGEGKLVYPVLAIFGGNQLWYLVMIISGAGIGLFAYFLQWWFCDFLLFVCGSAKNIIKKSPKKT